MKTTFSSFFLISSCYIFGQVGIATENPEATLDVNGDLRVRSIQEISNNTYVLATNAEGVLSKVKASNLTAVDNSSGSETRKIQYFGNYDGSKTISNGIFQFRINGPNSSSGTMDYDFRLLEDPAGTIRVFTNTMNRWGGVDGSPAGLNSVIVFNSSNWHDWKTIQPITANSNGHNTILSVDTSQSDTLAGKLYFYNLLAQRVDEGLKSLIINRY